MSHPFRFRPDTYDEMIFRDVTEHNEYGLPDRFDAGDVIIDIGTHIGSFSYATLTRGAGLAFGFEADPDNFALASKHLEGFEGRSKIARKAVWRSDVSGVRLRLFRPEDTRNTWGGNVVWSEGEIEVDTVSLDEVIGEALEHAPEVRLLKLDCEGSEFPILLSSKRLGSVREVVGEFHEFGGRYDEYAIPIPAHVPGYERYTVDDLIGFLKDQGFTVQAVRNEGTNLGIFRALRTAQTSLEISPTITEIPAGDQPQQVQSPQPATTPGPRRTTWIGRLLGAFRRDNRESAA